MNGLEYPKNRDEYQSTYQVNFNGIRHTKGAEDGDIYWMENMSSNGYPILSPRKPRTDTGKKADLGFICSHDKIAYVTKEEVEGVETAVFYFDDGINDPGLYKYSLSTEDFSVRRMTVINNQIMILPDNYVFNMVKVPAAEEGQPGTYADPVSIEYSYDDISVTFKRYGESNGATYECATIYSNTIDFESQKKFRIGDAVTISGSSIDDNNKSVLIRDIVGGNLIFSEYAFILDATKHTYTVTVGLPADNYSFDASTTADPSYVNFTLANRLTAGKIITYDGSTLKVDGTSVTPISVTDKPLYELLNTVPTYADTEDTITIKREAPNVDGNSLEYICTSANRVWGCVGDTIMASKLGDPFNWNVFDGIATDSYSLVTGTAGDFTGCIDYLGYPMFFKEYRIFKVYGSYPQQYEIVGSPSIGLKAGNNESLAVAGGILFYLSPHGIMSYTGSVPRLCSEDLGMDIVSAKAGSDGRKLYISAYDGTDYHMFVYDTFYDMWHREDDFNALQIHRGDKLYLADNTGKIWTPDGAWEEDTEVEWEFQTADLIMASFNNKGYSRLTVRSDTSQLGDDGYVKVYLKIDNEAEWEYVGELKKAPKHIDHLERIMRRGDRVVLKFAGNRPCDIYGISIDYYIGSDF